jgi:hypothetical protein
MRIAFRLSDSLFKQSVSKVDTKNFAEAHQLIKKAAQYFSYYEEYYFKYQKEYNTLE